jgi:hypothetical protein
MRKASMRLDNELEIVADLLHHVVENRRMRDSIVSGINLGGSEMIFIKIEPFPLRQADRIKHPFPVVEGITRRADNYPAISSLHRP